MTQPSIKAASLADQIKDMLVARIIAGDLQPGERLVELAIAKDAGTSQAPVREALHKLEGLGLIEFRRNRGAVVRAFSRSDLVEIYAVRAELEGFAAALVATQAPATGEALLAICNKMDARQGRDFAALNTDFHRAIVEAAANSTLLNLWEALDVQTRTALNTMQPDNHTDLARADHRKIAQAIRAGDADQARALMVDHINAVVR